MISEFLLQKAIVKLTILRDLVMDDIVNPLEVSRALGEDSDVSIPETRPCSPFSSSVAFL